MNYKVGDEVLVKAKIINSTRIYFGVEIEDNRFDVCEDDIIPAPDMTAEEAWKLAIKLRYMDFEDKIELFNLDPSPSREAWLEIMENMSPESVRDKIEEWEAEKEIKVGDVVIRCGESCIVTNKSRDDGFYDVLFEDGTTGAYQRSSLKKTGRHIDIDGLLKQIRGDE